MNTLLNFSAGLLLIRPSKRILYAMVLTFLLSFATTAVAQLMWHRAVSEKIPNAAVERNGSLKALPATLPQGRLYCSDGAKLGYLRFYPQSFQQILPEDALAWSKEGVAVSCEESWQSDSCKEALKALALVRKSIQRCQAGA